MAGYTRNDITNNIADGNIINASDFDGEFDAIEDAFDAATGHVHDGTSGNGAPIVKLGPTQDVDISATAVTPKTDNIVDLGSSTLEFKDLYIDGTANIDSLVADTADINGGTVDGASVGANTPGSGAFTTLSSNSTTTLNGTTIPASKTLVVTTDIGVSVQGYDADLAALAALSPANNSFIVGDGTSWVAENASQARSSLGATTVGESLFTLTNPSAVTFPRFNADNTVTALSDSNFRTAIGAGTVTSVGGTGTVNGITLTGSVSSSGNLTLGGSLSNVSLSTQVTGTLPIANGGTNATTESGARTNLGATTLGANLFTITNPSAITFPRFNADNTVSSLSASDFRTAIGAGTGTGDVTTTGTQTLTNKTISGASNTVTVDGTVQVGFRTIPQNSQSAAYTLVADDSGKQIFHPSADTTARTFTIPSNGSVAFPIGTAITFINQNGAGVITIEITSDTMRLAGAGTTGSRTLAANGIATAIKITSTEWIISGTGLT